MSHSRRQFLVSSTLASFSAAALGQAPQSTIPQQPANPGVPGAPPVLGVLPPTGPDVSPQDFVAAEKLMQVEMSAAERAEAAGNWRTSMAAVVERRVGPRRITLGETDVPATVWNPATMRVQGTAPASSSATDASLKFVSEGGSASPPATDAALAFSSVLDLSRWIRERKLTSERLTGVYLARLKQHDPQLKCVITLTEEHALQQARAADAEIAAGNYRGPLHGIPYGAKDLLDTAGIATTWGAEPFRNRVPKTDAAAIRLLNEAGAVLVAKLSLGALALNDVWFGGQTKNPWVLEEGASGSSAGPACAVAAGLVAFAIGSETQGSIISPSMRCGVTGLRPTFGRVPRTGAMTLSWTCDKLGPIARSAEDAVLVLAALSAYDPGDVASVPSKLEYDGATSLRKLRVGYFPKWMNEAPATEVDRNALATLKKAGVQTVEVSLPDWPYDSLNVILFAEAAAVFEEITLDHRVNQLKMQTPEAWPNTFRQSRFLSAVDFVQADRFRRKVAAEMARLMHQVDALLVPSMRDEMMVISNFTGHPSLTLPVGFVEISETRTDWLPESIPVTKLSPPRRVPYGVTLIGRLFQEGTLLRVGQALESAANMRNAHPAGFA
ncbi:amidase [Terriglobus sp.]|uniref:amidase n=1 Tax=Terriglobus sp. TaxID=1889013 RepID=UPI003B000B81